jgi:hypothetical protein
MPLIGHGPPSLPHRSPTRSAAQALRADHPVPAWRLTMLAFSGHTSVARFDWQAGCWAQ